MRIRAIAVLAAGALTLAGCDRGPAPPPPKPNVGRKQESVQIRAADGVTVFGTYVEPAQPRALILLFHQAESGQGEYAGIAPRLVEQGFATLTIDQRAGGNLFGGNWTVRQLGRTGDYLEAKQDLDAALDWARRKQLPIILWGSSYSASLIFLVATEHPQGVQALLAFSPDEYFDGKPSVKAAAAKLAVPVFVTSAQDATEVAGAKAIFDAVPAPGKRRFVPTRGGVHGSSTLLRDRNPGGAEPAWDSVLAFLDAAAPR